MSYPPPPGHDPNNPYAQQPSYGYPQQPPPAQPSYGYPQGQPGYGYPQQQGYGYPQQGQPGYYPDPNMQAPPGTVQASNGYINLHHLGPVQLATMGQRFLARLIDGLILSAIFFVLMFGGALSALGVVATAKDCGDDFTEPGYQACLEEQSEAGLGMIGGLLVMLLFWSAFLLVYEWVMVSFKGGTIGKMVLGLKVVREATGELPGPGAGFIRYIIPIVGAFLCYIGMALVYLSPFFDASGKLQGWHDRAAGTVVITK